MQSFHFNLVESFPKDIMAFIHPSPSNENDQVRNEMTNCAVAVVSI